MLKHLRSKALLVGAFSFLASAALAGPTQIIRNDPGGLIDQFEKKYAAWSDVDTQVVIDGECDSACTLITGLLPRRNVCVTPRAVLGFHSAWDTDPQDFSLAGTREIWSLYPKQVRSWLIRRGWRGPTPHPNLILISGAELQRFYRPCA